MDLFSGAHSQDQSWAQLGKQKVLSEYQEALFFFFCCEVDQAVAQVTQRDFRDSLFGNIQKPSGHSSEQSVLDDPT